MTTPRGSRWTAPTCSSWLLPTRGSSTVSSPTPWPQSKPARRPIPPAKPPTRPEAESLVRTPGLPYGGRMVILGSHGFRADDVAVATGLVERMRGLIGVDPRPLLLPTSSVHGFWLRQALQVVAIRPNREVLGVARLRRRGVITVPGARWMLELPLGHRSPATGERLTFVGDPGDPVLDGRTPVSLRHPDRQPGGRLSAA